MIELVDVCLDHPRGGSALVTDANLKVSRGEVVLIVGAAGVGTSRMVAASLGEVPAVRGRIELLGHNVGKLRRSSLRLLRRRIGVVPQDLCLLEDRSAQLNVGLPLEIDGVPRSVTVVRAIDLLTRLHLESEASLPVDCLSDSQRQRVAVARALIRDPELVLADHPTSMQDEPGAELVCAALAEAAANGAAVIVFGRDPTLRAIAHRLGWRELGMIDGTLKSFAAAEARDIDDVLIEMEEPPELAVGSNEDADVPNIVPFPLSARTAGVG